ncbi:tail fiber domain-containing protein [Parapedobacter sp. ISTM3]|uniref:tail fiber domain-containing protein n=1 Tax=Parapedobacter sp. ISTM3 TaxID=2800130 RepID=UPI0019038EA9|nr:tail fiber domain-containing protein [Parapedobacter sp. ISTM3]MBK1442742.1 tail fiber domain-containing protein [Parapedobacter sp. ISTM3]
MKRILLLLLCCSFLQVRAQVGIGTSNPLAGFHVADSNVLFSATGDVVSGTSTPINGEGRRMMWFADKAAFRAGYVGSFGATYWNANNIGNYSFATGYNTRASGAHAFAAGMATTASGDESVALGNNGTASANRAFAFNGTATGVGAVAIGSGAQATGEDALAMGPSAIAGGLASVVIGPSIANGNFAVAIGLQNSASGQFSVAIGKNARTAGRQGAMVLGDAGASFSSDSVYATANNQMTMRFIGGYKLYTSQNLSSGVDMAPGGGSWSSLSDRNKKENFEEIDMELVLQKVAAIPVTRWNYKSQPASQQHIGPTAQDFHAAFQLDGVDNDTTINTVDIDGVNMAAIQALEKRTAALRAENDALKAQVAAMNERMAALEKLMHVKNQSIDAVRE